MNIAGSLALYASVTKELGEQLAFPGSEAFYKGRLDFADREHSLS